MPDHASHDPTAPPLSPLPLTGERTVPGVPDETYWFERHVVAYRHVTSLAHGARVLDAGCGEGYGLALLRDAGAQHVTGADLDGATVAHARRRYGSDRVEVVECELMQLPLADDTIDLTVSFQVIEHVHDVPGYLAALERVTRPGGHVVLATPNRLTFTPDSDVPVNPFHVREFTADELGDEVRAAGLVPTELLGVHHGPRLRAWEHQHGTPFTAPMTSKGPGAWPPAYRALVHDVTVDDFVLRAGDLDGSLDLLLTCRVP
jgi:SAM-dependent methyltransferase